MSKESRFKQTDIGLIAEDWEIKKLDELTSFITDGKHGDCQNQKSSGYYFLSAKDVFDGRLDYSDAREITKEDFIETGKRTNLEAGCVLLSNSGTIGRLAVASDTERTKRTTFQKSVAIIKPDLVLLDSHFLYYYFLANTRRVKEAAGGTTQQNLLLKDLRSFKIAIPCLLIQGRQVNPLKLIDSKIELNRKMNTYLEAIGQAVFKRWFVDFEFPNQEGKPYKSSGGDMVESEKGEMPKGWEIKRFEEITEAIFSGGTPDTRNTEYWNGDYSWLSSGETSDHYVLKTEKKITKKGIENSSTRLAKKGDIVMASAGQGKTRGQVSLCLIDTYVNQSVNVVRPKNSIVPNSYLFFNLLLRYPQLRAISDSFSIRGSLTTKTRERFGNCSTSIKE